MDPAATAFHEESLSRWCRRETCAAAVVCVPLPENEALLFEGVDDPGHGGRANLLGGSKVAEGDGPSEDDDREGGETRSVETRALIFLA